MLVGKLHPLSQYCFEVPPFRPHRSVQFFHEVAPVLLLGPEINDPLNVVLTYDFVLLEVLLEPAVVRVPHK